MGKDTDGTNWITVRYTLDIRVMADNYDDALYYASLALPDYDLADADVEIISD